MGGRTKLRLHNVSPPGREARHPNQSSVFWRARRAWIPGTGRRGAGARCGATLARPAPARQPTFRPHSGHRAPESAFRRRAQSSGRPETAAAAGAPPGDTSAHSGGGRPTGTAAAEYRQQPTGTAAAEYRQPQPTGRYRGGIARARNVQPRHIARPRIATFSTHSSQISHAELMLWPPEERRHVTSATDVRFLVNSRTPRRLNWALSHMLKNCAVQ